MSRIRPLRGLYNIGPTCHFMQPQKYFIDPKIDPFPIPICLELYSLPRKLWRDEIIEFIRNLLGKYIYQSRESSKGGSRECVIICVEMDLGKCI